MNEVEASKKVCPLLGGYCQASDCMMWEWDTEYDYSDSPAPGSMYAVPIPPTVTISKTEGHCGLKNV